MNKLDPKFFSACICTPNQSPLSLGAAHVRSLRHAVYELERRTARVEFSDEIPDPVVVDIRERINLEQDLIRTRSRLMRLFLEKATAEWMCFWDDDVSIDDPTAFITMLTLGVQCDVDAVGAIVPRKYHDEGALVRNVRWAFDVMQTCGWSHHQPGLQEFDQKTIARAKDVLDHPLRYAFSQDSFALRKIVPRPDYVAPHTALWRVDQIGMGCVFMRRRAVRKFIEWLDRERPKLRANDPRLGGKTTAAFLIDIDDNADLLSEDNSMWSRWAEAGLHLFAYVGPGSDRFVHTGATAFSADLSCILGGPEKATTK